MWLRCSARPGSARALMMMMTMMMMNKMKLKTTMHMKLINLDVGERDIGNGNVNDEKTMLDTITVMTNMEMKDVDEQLETTQTTMTKLISTAVALLAMLG